MVENKNDLTNKPKKKIVRKKAPDANELNLLDLDDEKVEDIVIAPKPLIRKKTAKKEPEPIAPVVVETPKVEEKPVVKDLDSKIKSIRRNNKIFNFNKKKSETKTTEEVKPEEKKEIKRVPKTKAVVEEKKPESTKKTKAQKAIDSMNKKAKRDSIDILLGNTKFDVVEEETDKKSTNKKSSDKKKSDKKSTKEEVDKETKSTEKKKIDIKEKYKKIKDNLLDKINKQKDKTKTEEKKTAKTETKTKVKAETKTKTGTKSTKSNNTNKKKKTTPAIEYDDSVRTKRVLKPGVAKAISIILNVLYYIVFLFLVLLLLIVFVQRISNNEFAFGGVRIYNIATQSMASKYDIGDVILAKDVDPSELKVGDDIAYRGKVGTYKDRIITHEIQAISQNDDGSYSIITKGLANDIEDPEINSSQVQGKIVKKLKLLSAISKIASNNFGLFFAIFIPIALIIFVNMIRIINADDDKEENQRE